MNVSQYQMVDNYNIIVKDDVERMAGIVMDYYKLTYNEVDLMKEKTFLKKLKKITKSFEKATKKPFYCFLKFQKDASKLTFGQFIESSYFLKNEPMQNIHLLAATIIKKNNKDHNKLSKSILKLPINYILNDCLEFINSLKSFLISYSGLFEISEEENEEIIDKPQKKNHPFVEKYGWIFSAKQVAEFEGITLNAAYDLPVIQAFNTLSLLKSKKDYEKQTNK